ncbi:MAG TPA: hypothetical protein VG388_07225 [Solirubrobacteraceae bacterium]|jgi:hypothetical protein|nr:hypothetical protein [Solirubrobacteraceae bacterium]
MNLADEPGEPDTTDPPGSVSNQNQEEAEAGHDTPGAGPRSGESRGAGSSDAEGESSGSRPGAASEGSQATGHPDNAG